MIYFVQINDDEAERRQSRLIEDESFSESASNIVENTETITRCLQMHSENVG